MRWLGLIGVAALAIAAIVYALGYGLGPDSSLQFRDRAYPPGFRDLIVGSPISRLDPIAGPQPAPHATPSAKGPWRSAREVCDALFRDASVPAAGPANSSVQVAALFDYRCPYCRTLSGILADMHDRGDVRVVYHEWPVLGGPSDLAARAALAADRQGAYLAFHRRLMASRFIPTLPLIEAVAADLGLDRPRLLADMASSDIAAAIRRTTALASESGLAGTPVLVVGRTVIEGDVSRRQLERVIRRVAADGLAGGC